MNNMQFQKEFDYFDELYSFIDDIISIINQDGIIVYINKKLPDNINLIGEYFEKVNDIENKETNDGIRFILENGGEFTSKYSVKYKDIDSNFISYNKSIFIQGMGNFIINHTKYLDADNQEPISHEMNYNEVLDKNLSLVCYIDKNNKIVYSNELFNNYFNFHPNDRINNDFDLIEYFANNYKLLNTYKIDSAFGKEVNQKIKEFETIDNNQNIIFLEVKENESIFLGKVYKQIIITDITTSKKINLGFTYKKIFSDIMESMPLMVHSLNNRKEIVEVSNYWLQKLGYNYDEVIGKHSYDFMTEESKEYALNNIVPNFFNNNSWSNIPYTFITKSGEKIDVLMTILILKDRFGFQRSFSISIDITENNKLYQVVKENEVLLNTIFENAPFGIEILDNNGNKIKVNQKIKDIAQAKNYELEMNIENNRLAEQLNIMERFQKVLNGENLVLKEVKIDYSLLVNYDENYLNSKIGYYDFHFSPILKYNEKNNQKEIDIIVCFVNDITEEVSYKSQLEFQSTILNNISEIVIATDNNFNINYWNKVAETTYGYSAEETIGKKTSNFYHNYSYFLDKKEIKLTDNIKFDNWKGEIKQITNRGIVLYIDKIKTLINDIEGNCVGNLYINRDITNRKIKENEFIQNKNLLDTIFDNAPISIQIFDTKGKLIRMNESKSSLIDKINIINFNDYNIFEDENIKINNLQEYFRKAINGEIVKLNRYKYSLGEKENIWGSTNETRYYNLDILPLLDENNEVIAIANFYEDITDKINYENKLIENNNLFRLLENTANIGAWELEIKNNKLTWSEQTYKIHGLEYEKEVDVNKALDYYVGEDREKVSKRLTDLTITFVDSKDIYYFRDALGNYKYVETSGFCGFENEELIKIYGTIQDVTESYIKDKKIKENEELLSSINTNIKEALYRTSPHNGVIYANKAAYMMFGFRDINHMNEFGIDNVYCDENPRADYLNKFENESQITNQEIKFKRLDGTEFWGLNSFTKRIDENGELYFDGAIIDISEIKEKEQELNKINNNLEKLVEERTKELEKSQNIILQTLEEEKKYLELKTNFITTVSHEFRTPLTIVQTSIYLLEKFFEKNNTIQFSKNITKINNAIESMVVLLDNVLNLNNFNLQNIKTYKQEFNFYELVVELIESHKDINKNKFKINLFNELSEIDYLIFSDKNMVYQILNNLLENAVNYSARSRIIDVKIAKILYNDLPYMSVEVKDYGIGIDMNEVNNLFNSINYNKTNENTGLYITKTWLDLLKGIITYESEINKYTIAKIQIPFK